MRPQVREADPRRPAIRHFGNAYRRTGSGKVTLQHRGRIGEEYESFGQNQSDPSAKSCAILLLHRQQSIFDGVASRLIKIIWPQEKARSASSFGGTSIPPMPRLGGTLFTIALLKEPASFFKRSFDNCFERRGDARGLSWYLKSMRRRVLPLFVILLFVMFPSGFSDRPA